jgi:integral membrane sensor domain MASE1
MVGTVGIDADRLAESVAIWVEIAEMLVAAVSTAASSPLVRAVVRAVISVWMLVLRVAKLEVRVVTAAFRSSIAAIMFVSLSLACSCKLIIECSSLICSLWRTVTSCSSNIFTYPLFRHEVTFVLFSSLLWDIRDRSCLGSLYATSGTLYIIRTYGPRNLRLLNHLVYACYSENIHYGVLGLLHHSTYSATSHL